MDRYNLMPAGGGVKENATVNGLGEGGEGSLLSEDLGLFGPAGKILNGLRLQIAQNPLWVYNTSLRMA